jgi:competence protein ComEA
MGQGAAPNTSSALPLVLSFALACTLLAGCGGSGPSRSEPIIISTPESTPTPSASPTPAPLRVHVSGAVHQPDQVQLLPPGSIVQDAIEAAGGPTGEADLERMNLALELADQMHVHVPEKGEENGPAAVSGGESDDGAGETVNINTATQTELETLPGVGPVTAGKIIAYRESHGPFPRIEDIEDVPGIGPATFEGLKDLIRVD